MKKFLLLSSFFVSLYGNTLHLAVAANVSYAIKPLIKEFNKTHPNTKVRVTLGSSGKLTAQIRHGAPYHIFMSANMKYPQALYIDGMSLEKPVIYADGGLAYLSSKKQNFSLGANLLKEKKIKNIAIANPQIAPYGKASLEALENTGLYESIKSKFVYAESASSVVTYALKAADIGLVPKSALFSPYLKNFKEGEKWKDVDTSLYTPIHQGIIVLKKAQENKEAMAFYKFILSKSAKKILKDFGYIVYE